MAKTETPRALIETFRTASAHLLRLGRAFGAVVAILGAGDVGHAPLMPVPTVEAVHLESPETGLEVTGHDDALRVSGLTCPAHVEDCVITRRNPQHLVLAPVGG